MPLKKIPKELREQYKKTMKRAINKNVGAITIIITEDTYDKAITAFNFAVSAIEMGIKVNMFFTARGINILRKSYKPRRAKWGEAPIGWKEFFIKRRGGATLGQLMYQAKDMGVHMNICYSSMISTGLEEKMFINGIKVQTMPEFLQNAIETNANFLIG
jgi:predicted peroxiredoxin